MKLEYNNKTDEFILIIQKLEIENKELFKKNKDLSNKLFNLDLYKENRFLKKDNKILIKKIRDLQQLKISKICLEKKIEKNNLIKSYDNFERKNNLNLLEKKNSLNNFKKCNSLKKLKKQNSLKISKIIPDEKSKIIHMEENKKYLNLTGEGFLKKCNLLFDLFENKQKKNKKKTILDFVENLNKKEICQKFISNSYFIYKKNNLEILIDEIFKKKSGFFDIILNFTICNYNDFVVKIFDFDFNFESEFIKILKIDENILLLNSGEKKEIQVILNIKEKYILEMSLIFLNFSIIQENLEKKEKIILPLSINKFILYQEENLDNFKLISTLKKVSELKIKKKKNLTNFDLEIIFPNLTELAPKIFGLKLISIFGSNLLYINNTKNEFIKIELFSFQKSPIIELYIKTIQFILNNY